MSLNAPDWMHVYSNPMVSRYGFMHEAFQAKLRGGPTKRPPETPRVRSEVASNDSFFLEKKCDDGLSLTNLEHSHIRI